MIFVGKYLILLRQVRAATVDQVNAGQVILFGDFLCAQMFFHGHGEIAAALHRGIITDDDTFLSRHPANAGDHPGGGHILAIHVICGELGKFQKGRSLVQQPVNPLAGQKLAAVQMTLAIFLTAAAFYEGQLVPEVRHNMGHSLLISQIFQAVTVYIRLNDRHELYHILMLYVPDTSLIYTIDKITNIYCFHRQFLWIKQLIDPPAISFWLQK